MKTRTSLVLSAAAALCAGLALSVPAQADIVTDWSGTAGEVLRQISAPGAAIPGSASASERVPNYAVDLATFHVALYDTVVAFKGGYDSFAAAPAKVPRGASMEAAANEAAHAVLVNLFPSKSAVYQPAYESRMAALVAQGVSAQSIADGRAAGLDVATQVLAWRSEDGRLTVLPPFTNGTGPGAYVSTNTAALVGRINPYIRPFSLASAKQFRPKGPPRLFSLRYARSFWETKTFGGPDATSTRSVAQDNLAKFHTEGPPGFWTRNLLRFATFPKAVDNARLLAAMWVAHADVTIGCFEAKYHFLAWRPFTAIPAGDADGNRLTLGDTAWASNEPTPNHPEYPAAHSCASGASFEVIARLNGTRKIDFIMDSRAAGLTQPELAYHNTGDFIDEVAEARVLGGMHFRYATEDGTELGRDVARHVLRYGFRPVKSRSE